MVYQQIVNGGTGGIKDVLINRPPTVMFLLCIASCALATMSLSFYFNLTNQKIHNPDVIGWNTLLTEISKMNFCLLNSSSLDNTHFQTNNLIQKATSNINSLNLTEASLKSEGTDKFKRVNVSLKLLMSAKFAQSLQPVHRIDNHDRILASSEISLMDMSRAVPSNYHQHKIRILLNLPLPVNGSSISEQDVDKDVYACFNIEAPLTLLQDLNSSMHAQHECTIHRDNRNSPRKLLAHTGDHLPPSWCNQRGASPITLDYSQDPSWSVYITVEDKKLINLHLMATSVFLFALFGVIVLVIFVRGFFGSRKLHSQRYSTDVYNSDILQK